jgi:hypothetical protein
MLYVRGESTGIYIFEIVDPSVFVDFTAVPRNMGDVYDFLSTV